MNSKAITCLIIALLTTLSLSAQRSKSTSTTTETIKLEDLPRRPIDTITTEDPETLIIIYSNNTWSYYRPSLERLGTLAAYTHNWDTTSIFAYRNFNHEDLPAIVELSLVYNLSDFHAPIIGTVFSKFGPRKRRAHNGVDIPLKTGEPIYATFDGRVRYARYNSGGYGYLVILRHPNGLETWYAHLAKTNVEQEDYIKAGQVIGFGGNTGRSRGPHLHFETRYQDQAFDPEFIIDFESGNLRYQTFVLEKSFFNIHSRATEILEEDDEGSGAIVAGNEYGESASSEEILNRIAQAQQQEELKETEAAAASVNTTPKTGAVYHTIKSGDILGKLAINYGVSIDQICRLNGITRTTVLQLGRKLRIK